MPYITYLKAWNHGANHREDGKPNYLTAEHQEFCLSWMGQEHAQAHLDGYLDGYHNKPSLSPDDFHNKPRRKRA